MRSRPRIKNQIKPGRSDAIPGTANLRDPTTTRSKLNINIHKWNIRTDSRFSSLLR
jgi:hypothetical protein